MFWQGAHRLQFFSFHFLIFFSFFYLFGLTHSGLESIFILDVLTGRSPPPMAFSTINLTHRDDDHHRNYYDLFQNMMIIIKIVMIIIEIMMTKIMMMFFILQRINRQFISATIFRQIVEFSGFPSCWKIPTAGLGPDISLGDDDEIKHRIHVFTTPSLT